MLSRGDVEAVVLAGVQANQATADASGDFLLAQYAYRTQRQSGRIT
jgi:hypothetical protein